MVYERGDHFIICVPLFMIKEEYLVFILVAVAAFPRTISMEVMGITGIYAFLPGISHGNVCSQV